MTKRDREERKLVEKVLPSPIEVPLVILLTERKKGLGARKAGEKRKQQHLLLLKLDISLKLRKTENKGEVTREEKRG